MIQLPNFSKAMEYENNFYLSCDTSRLAKFICHYELFKLTKDLPGAIVECGVFKGTALARFAAFRNLFNNPKEKKVLGFDVFDKFPETNFEGDKKPREFFINEAGDESISIEQLMEVLKQKRIDENVELIKGDITKTVPKYVTGNPNFKISLLNLDVDIYEPSVTILEHLYPKIVPGGILILDDYGRFPGETKAVDDYFKDKKITINKFPYIKATPVYIIKEG